jgi:alkane 1-monooxygenase
MHFAIEHVHGHHHNVATRDDPATARKGETVYAFWLRSIVGSYISAWNIEVKRTKMLYGVQKQYSLNNMMVQYLSFLQLGLISHTFC